MILIKYLTVYQIYTIIIKISIIHYRYYKNLFIFSYDKPAHKIMDKIAEHETDVCMVVVI